MEFWDNSWILFGNLGLLLIPAWGSLLLLLISFSLYSFLLQDDCNDKSLSFIDKIFKWLFIVSAFVFVILLILSFLTKKGIFS